MMLSTFIFTDHSMYSNMVDLVS